VKGVPVDGDKMILWRVHYYIRSIVGEYLSKPLFTCVWCMASVWSIPVFFPFMFIIHEQIKIMNIVYTWLIYIPVVSAMAGYLDTKINEI
jgi:hypothetical protein